MKNVLDSSIKNFWLGENSYHKKTQRNNLLVRRLAITTRSLSETVALSWSAYANTCSSLGKIGGGPISHSGLIASVTINKYEWCKKISVVAQLHPFFCTNNNPPL